MGWVPLAFGSEWAWLLGGLVPVEVFQLVASSESGICSQDRVLLRGGARYELQTQAENPAYTTLPFYMMCGRKYISFLVVASTAISFTLIMQISEQNLFL